MVIRDGSGWVIEYQMEITRGENENGVTHNVMMRAVS